MSIDGEITRESVLEKARDENSELHKCFEWDDTIAAEKYRRVNNDRKNNLEKWFEI